MFLEKKHQRPSQVNQQIAKSIRPQMPRDASADGQNELSGKMPAGYISTFAYGTGKQTKYSPARGVGHKIY